jgi:hypothetical protein
VEPQPKRRAAFKAAAVAIRSLRRKEFARREFMELLRPGRPRAERVTGNGTIYLVTLSSLAEEGTLGISIAAGTASDLAGNLAPPATSTTFTVDNSAPAVTISAPSANFADGLPVTYTVSYADANFSASTLTAANVTLNRTGTANGVVSVSGTGTTRTVTLSSITGDGLMGISVGAGTAIDLSGNLAPAAGPSATFTVDNTRPAVTISSPSASFAKSGPVTYTVTYADANFGASSLTAGLIALNRTGTASGNVSVTGGGTTYTVTLAGITGDGTLGISIGAGSATDLAGNSALAAGPSAVFTVDNTRPAVSISAPSSSFARSGPVSYAVTFSDENFSASTLAASSITLNLTGSANGAVSVSGSGADYIVTIANVTGDGTLGFSIAEGTATDLAGNAVPAAGPSATFTVDNTVPTVTIGPPSATLTASTAVTYAIAYDATDIDAITLSAANVVLNKTGTAQGTVSVSGTGNARTITVFGINGDGTLGISLVAGTAADFAGNPAAAGGPSATFTVDNTAPVITSATSASATYRTAYTYTITASESATFNATGLPAGLNVDTAIGVISGKPTQTGAFTVGLSATDAAGKTGTATLAITVSQFLLTVTANSASRTYGAANPTLTGTVTGVQNSDGISATYSTVATAASSAGTYPIVPTVVDPNNKLSNCTVVLNNGTLTISPAALSAAASDASRNYGAANPAFTGTLAGVQNADNLTLSFATPAVLTSSPGEYVFTPSVSDPNGKLTNYSLTSTPGILTVRNQANFAGIARDGYVAGATVFFDANKNRVRDANEPSTQTDAAGNFSLALGSQFDLNANGQFEPSEGSLVLTGGIDIATGLAMKTPLTAPPGSTVVNPLTTILTATLDQNPGATVAQAQAQLAAALNIPAGVDLTTYNPLAGGAAADPVTPAILKAGAKVQDTLVQVSALLSGVSGQTASQVANTVAKGRKRFRPGKLSM